MEHPNKRLNNVIKTVVTSSKLACMTRCSMTEGCLAVNVIGNHVITCELTAGLSNQNEMEDDSGSKLFVLGRNNTFTLTPLDQIVKINMSHFAYACKAEGEKRNLPLNFNTCRAVKCDGDFFRTSTWFSIWFSTRLT